VGWRAQDARSRERPSIERATQRKQPDSSYSDHHCWGAVPRGSILRPVESTTMS